MCNGFHAMGKSSGSGIYYIFTLHVLVVWAVHGSTLHHLNTGYFRGPEGTTLWLPYPASLSSPYPAAVTVVPGSGDRHGHVLWPRRGQLEKLCLGWVQAIVWCCLQMVRGEGRGVATLGRHMLVAGKWHPSSGWGPFSRAEVTMKERSNMQAAVLSRGVQLPHGSGRPRCWTTCPGELCKGWRACAAISLLDGWRWVVPRGLDLVRIPFLCSEGLVFSPQVPREMNCCFLASLTRKHDSCSCWELAETSWFSQCKLWKCILILMDFPWEKASSGSVLEW